MFRIPQPLDQGPDRRETRKNLEAAQVRRRDDQKSRERRRSGAFMISASGWITGGCSWHRGPLAAPGACPATPGHYRRTPPLPAEGGACVASANLSHQAAYHTDDQTRQTHTGEGAQGWADHTETGNLITEMHSPHGRGTVTASDICQGVRARHCAACLCGLWAGD